MRQTFVLCMLLVAPSAWAGCGNAVVLFQCQTTNNKQVEVCDHGQSLSYAFGKPGKPELAFSVPRSVASTYQWEGFGSTMSYSVKIPNQEASYTVFHSTKKVFEVDQDPDVEMGIEVEVKDDLVARIKCNLNKPTINRLDGVKLKRTP